MRYVERWRERALYVAAVVFFALAALGALYLGRANLLKAFTFSERVNGAFLLLGAAVLAWGCASAAALAFGKGGEQHAARCRRRKNEYLLAVFAAALIVLVMAFMMILTGLEAGEMRRRAFITLAGFGMASFLLAVYVFVARGPTFPQPRKLAAGAVVATLLAVGNFAYTQIHLPSRTEASIFLETSFGDPVNDDDGNGVTIPFTVHIKVGPQPVYILMAAYSAKGRLASLRPQPPSPDILENEVSDEWLDPSATTDVSGMMPVEAGKFLGPGNAFYAPNEEMKFTKFIRTPNPLEYDSIELTTHVSIVRRDKAELDIGNKGYPHDGRLLYSGTLAETSELRKQLRSPIEVFLGWPYRPGDDDFGKPLVEFVQDGNKHDLYERYGYWGYSNTNALPLTAIK